MASRRPARTSRSARQTLCNPCRRSLSACLIATRRRGPTRRLGSWSVMAAPTASRRQSRAPSARRTGARRRTLAPMVLSSPPRPLPHATGRVPLHIRHVWGVGQRRRLRRGRRHRYAVNGCVGSVHAPVGVSVCARRNDVRLLLRGMAAVVHRPTGSRQRDNLPH